MSPAPASTRRSARGPATRAPGRGPRAVPGAGLLSALLLAGALLSGAGCTSLRRDVDVAPTPAALPLIGALQGDNIEAPPTGHLLVALSHAERRDERPDGAWELVVRLRLENHDADVLEFVPAGLRVVDAELREFGAPRWDALPGLVARGETAMWEARLPLPRDAHPSDRGMRGLQLRAEVVVDGLARLLDVTFTRTEPQVIVEQMPYPVGWHRFGYGFYGNWAW